MKPEEYVGKTIQLIHMQPGQDGKPETSVMPGDKGVCKAVDGMGQLLMSWDNGSTLSLIPDADAFVLVEESNKLKHLKRFKL
jgi:hypothetical protein